MAERKVIVHLYVPVTSSQACTPIVRPPLAKLRNRARRAYDFWHWRALRNVSAEYSSHLDCMHSNRGDIAIGSAIQMLIRNFDETRDIDIHQIAWHSLERNVVDDINRNAGIFIIGGGGYFHAGDSGKIFRLCHDDLPLIKAIKVPKIAFSVGINRLLVAGMPDKNALKDNNSLQLLKQYSDTIDIVAVRDLYSMRSFEAAGARNTRLVADPVFFWPDLPNRKDNRVEDTINVGLNFAFHGRFSVLMWEKNVKTYLSFLLALSREKNIRFFYFVHFDSEHYIAKCLRSAGIKVDVVSAEPLEMLYKYGRLDIHIGQMMHSCIMASSVYTPCLGLAYDTKNRGFFEVIGMGNYVIDLNEVSVEKLLRKTKQLIDNKDELSKEIKNKKRELLYDMNSLLSDVRQKYLCLEKIADPARG